MCSKIYRRWQHGVLVSFKATIGDLGASIALSWVITRSPALWSWPTLLVTPLIAIDWPVMFVFSMCSKINFRWQHGVLVSVLATTGDLGASFALSWVITRSPVLWGWQTLLVTPLIAIDRPAMFVFCMCSKINIRWQHAFQATIGDLGASIALLLVITRSSALWSWPTLLATPLIAIDRPAMFIFCMCSKIYIRWQHGVLVSFLATIRDLGASIALFLVITRRPALWSWPTLLVTPLIAIDRPAMFIFCMCTKIYIRL